MIRIPLIILMLLTLARPAWSQAEEWSFSHNPIPNFNDLTWPERKLVYEAVPFRGPEPTENTIDRFKPLYAQFYPNAPPIPDDSILESRFLRLLIETQVNGGFSPLLAGANRDRIRKHGARYQAATGRTVCSLRMPDLEEWPFLDEALRTARLSLVLPDQDYPLYGVQIADEVPSVILAEEIMIYAGARIDLVRGDPPEPAESYKSSGLSAEKIVEIQNAARRGDLDFVLDMVGACWAR